MTNVLGQKSIKCIEWSVKLSSHSNINIVSDTFLFQDRKCYLELSLRLMFTPFRSYSIYLYFKSNGNLQTPVPITLRVAIAPDTLEVTPLEVKELSIESVNQTIWSYGPTDGVPRPRMLFTFEITINLNSSKEDKSVQTGSYLNGEVSVESSYEDFTKMLDVGSDHDAEIKCGEHTIKVHRIILSTRSEIFSKMLQSDMKEDRSGIIEIEDLDISCVRDFVRYLYTGAMPQLTFEKAEMLYEAGDKYAVRSLMIRSSEYLQDNLSPENVVRCFALADAHSDQNLKDCVLTYMLDEKVYLQEEVWLPFCDSYPKIANEVYRLSYKNHDSMKKI